LTTVIAVKHDKGVTFAADTQATGESGDIYRVVKAHENGPFIIGGAGDCAPLDIAQYIWKPPMPTPADKKDLLRFMIVKAVPSLKKVFKDNDYEYSPEPSANQSGFTIIIVLYGEIFVIEKEFDVSMPQFNVAGIGSGAAYAIGAIRTGSSIKAAMEVAAENDVSTSAPFTYLEQSK
jgi:ATP-dependent protease HslVU (ClpYQ) peptidase subunit